MLVVKIFNSNKISKWGINYILVKCFFEIGW